MKIKISQDKTIEIKAKWIGWGLFIMIFVLPSIKPLGEAVWQVLDEFVCNQDSVCRSMRKSAKEIENIRKEVERLGKEADKNHQK